MDCRGVDCDVFISCLDSHSDGTHSLQWWASDVQKCYIISAAEWTWCSPQFNLIRKIMFLIINNVIINDPIFNIHNLANAQPGYTSSFQSNPSVMHRNLITYAAFLTEMNDGAGCIVSGLWCLSFPRHHYCGIAAGQTNDAQWMFCLLQ